MTQEVYNQTQLVCTIIQAVSAVAAVIATAWIAMIVDRSARLLAKWEHERAVRDSWSNIDAVALGNPELLRVADGLLHPPNPQMTDAERQKRWFGYMLCNVLESSLFANKLGVSADRERVIQGVKEILRPAVADDGFYEITQQHGQHPEFSRLCREVRSQIAKPRPPAPSTP